MMRDAHRQIEELQQSIDNLVVRRANVLSELGRLRKYLAAAAPEGAPDTQDDEEIEELAENAMTAEPDLEVVSKNGDHPVAASS